MADPLKLLQECALGKRELSELTHDGILYYVFGDVAYPHDEKTNLSVYNKPDEYYSIESILYLWKNRDVQHNAYVKDVSGKGIQPVTRMQRRELIDYLKGDLTTLPKTNVLAPIATAIPVSRLVDEYETVRKKPRLDQVDKGHRIDEILDHTADRLDIAQVRGLSSELPAEKIALLRTRVKKNLKNVVKSIEDDSFPSDSQMPDASVDSVGMFIQSKEHTWKNRTTCIESHAKDYSNILSVLSNIRAKEKNARHKNMLNISNVSSSTNGTRQNSSINNSTCQNSKPRANINTGYSRYDQEIFQKDSIADFQIETDLSFHGTSFRQIRDAANKSSITNHLQNQSLPNTSTQQRSINNTIQQQTNRQIPSSVPNQLQQQQQRNLPQKKVSRTPIIIVPASSTSLITMYNVIDILQDLKFVSMEEKKAKQYRRENEVLLQIRKNGSTVPYRVLDNPLKLKEEDWDRVVAVFVQGPAWQFKGWKWGNNPVELFSHIPAFHLKFEEQKLDSNIAKWSVNILSLSKSKRHLDKAILHKFWDTLERHIAKNKPHLRY